VNSPRPDLIARAERILRGKTTAWAPVNRGYTPAERWLATTSSSAVFVKCGVTPLTAKWLRREFHAYGQVKGSFVPKVIGWEDHENSPLLILEDLSQSFWPPPWARDRIEQVRECLDEMHGTRPAMPSYEAIHGRLSGWNDVAADPAEFLSLKMASSEWLDKSLPTLMKAESACSTAGEALTHWDIRSDNLCITPHGVKLIDWPASCLSNPKLDLGFWLPSLASEDGPLPEAMLPREPEVAAWICGFFAARAGQPKIADAPLVRSVQRRQLATALPWAIRALHLSDALG
jgi:thiamine kinase-like enzyme